MSLSKPTAFYLQASIICFFLAGSVAPTPLYVVYQAAFGFSPITITVVFGIYALAVLSSLLVAGSLSDYVGRRPVLLVTTLLQALTMVIFATAESVHALLVARVVQGLATGAAAGAVGAGMLDLDRAKGTVANAVAPMLGTASGGLLSGLVVQYLPWPTHLVYCLLGFVFVAQAIGVVLMPESATTRSGALASLRPHLSIPPHVKGPFFLAVPALAGTWSLIGFYGSLGPTLVRKLADSTSLVLGGLVVFTLASSGALTVFFAREQPAARLLRSGTALLFGGVALTLVALAFASVPLFFVGSGVAGAGFGASFQGAIRTVLPLARAHERAGVLSVLYVVAYLAMGLPAVLAGVRVVHGGGVLETAREYGLGVMTLAALAFIGTVWQKPEVRARSLSNAPSSAAQPVAEGGVLPAARHRAEPRSAHTV